MLFWLIIGIVTLCLVYLLVKEAVTWYQLKRYTKQGFVQLYYPFLGEFKPILDGQNCKNEFSVYDRLAKQYKGKPGLAMNHSSGFSSWVQLLDIDLIREFLNMENEIAVRVPHVDIKTQIGFLMIAGENALKQRLAFTSIFHRENLTRLAPQIYSTIKKHFESSFVQTSNSKNCGPNGVGIFADSNKFLEGLMKQFSKNLVYHDSIEVPTSESGLTPAEEFIAIVDLALSPRAGTSLINFVFGGIPHEHNWLSGSREVKSRGELLEKTIKNYIMKREVSIRGQEITQYDRCQFNIIDAMILHNLECESKDRRSEILSLDDMAGNCNMFTFASFDTTLTSSSSLLFHLGQSHALQEQLLAEIKSSGFSSGIISIDQIDECKLLNEVVAEALRIYPPGPISFDRLITKDFALGKYRFYKGDTLSLSFAPNMWDESLFASGKQFALGNRNNSNKKYYLPFSTGRRACVGQLLAELELKQLVVYVLPRYKIEPISKPEEVRYYLSFAMKLGKEYSMCDEMDYCAHDFQQKVEIY